MIANKTNWAQKVYVWDFPHSVYEFHQSFWVGYCGQIYKMSTLIL